MNSKLHFSVHYFSLIISAVLFLNSFANADNNTDYSTLVQFGKINKQLSWNFDEPMNTWQGVTLDATGRVSKLVLNDKNLNPNSGIFYLQRLTALKYLDLSYNNLWSWGSIDFNTLEVLKLNNNNYLGNFPVELLESTDLRVLHLQNNHIYGEIPVEFEHLTELEELNLSNNELSGCYYSELSFLCNIPTANISYGNELDSSWGEFCSIGKGSCIPNSPCNKIDSVSILKLYRNLGVDVNQTLNNWPGLKLNGNGCVSEIDLEWNASVVRNCFQFPKEIGSLSELVGLTFSELCFEGPIPVELGNVTSLRYLNFDECEFYGNIPKELGKLENLLELNIVGGKENFLSGNIPVELGNLKKLVDLSVYVNDLNGGIPSILGDLFNLKRLNLRSNNLIGCFSTNLLKLCDKADVILDYENSFDADWEDFCNTKKGACYPNSVCHKSDSINLVAVYNNFTAGSLPWDLSKSISTWEGIKINENGCVSEFVYRDYSVNGTIAPEIANLKDLTKLDLEENSIDGNIPKELVQLEKLTYLSLGCNNLTGSIPLIPNLTNLYLEKNNFSGPLPEQLSELTKLEVLYLYNNQFEGEIPGSYSNLTNLGYMNLENNNLNGCFNMALKNLCNISQIRIDAGNNFDKKWGEFCNYLANIEENIYISGNQTLNDSTYVAKNTIIIQDGEIRINSSQKTVNFNAGDCIHINGNFTVEPKTNLIISAGFCE